MSADKIALISFHTCPLAPLGEGKAGGMNVYVKALSRHLGMMGLKVDVFTRCHEDQEKDVVDLGENVRLVHLKGGPPDESLDNFFEYLPRFLDELIQFRHDEGANYRLVHSHYWLSGWVGERAAKSWGVAHVMSPHTLAEVKMQARAGEKETPVRSEVEKSLLASAHLILASSPHEKDAMVRLYNAPAHRIQIVPCGVDLSLFKPLDILEARKRLGLNGEKVIIYVGRIEPIKGLDLLLRSAAIMDGKDSLKVMVIGGDASRERELQRLNKLTDELGLNDTVEFMGVVDQRLLPIYYNAADVCVVPSYYESFSLVALEAHACGIPVVAYRVGGLPSVIENGSTGYLMSWRCPEPLADSLEVIFSSKGLRKSMSIAARKRAESLGWDKVAKETFRLYDSL